MRAMQLVSQMLAQTSPSTHSSSFSALTPCPPSVTCTERTLHDAGAPSPSLTMPVKTHITSASFIAHKCVNNNDAHSDCKRTAGQLRVTAGLVLVSHRGKLLSI